MISKNSLNLLEFRKLLTLISGLANSAASGNAVMDIHPLDDRSEIVTRQNQIAEIRRMSQEGGPLQVSGFTDISPLFLKIRPEGAVLEATELAQFIAVLTMAFDISSQMKERDDLPFLRDLTQNLTGFPDILNTLRKSIDSEGNILDSASFLLADLRQQIRKLESRIRKKFEELIRDENIAVFLQDNFITTRSGRWVIPVRMDAKGQVPGVVHDVSKSGETAFIEPLSIIHQVNELENLIAEQKSEEIRILRSICSRIRTVIDDMHAEFDTIVYLDVLDCLAKFADMQQMEIPQINDSERIHLKKARHPLLQLSLQKSGVQHIVPLDVQLGGDNTVMVITGANAGGKTISIKTIGLLLLMALSGMPVPADSSSGFPLIHNLLVDIGDEQSIEDNLSTFSAHISNISDILKRTDLKTVVLIDELGTGTDPEEGAALACAILNAIRKSGALVFATTHLSDIKGFVHRTEGMVNASMEFDQKTFTPLYRLRLGEPGQSHALEIARRYGLPDSLIYEAKGMLGSMKLELDNMIADLNEKRLRYDNLLQELGKKQAAIEEQNARLQQMLAEAEIGKKEVFAKTYREAAGIISDTKKQMSFFLDEMKKRKREDARKLKKVLEAKQAFIEEKIREYNVGEGDALTIDEVKKGDMVYVSSLGYDAAIVDVNRKSDRVKVNWKNMEIEVPLSDIRSMKGKAVAVQASGMQTSPDEIVPSRINLVGLRVDEALSRLEKILNHASLAEMTGVTVIHGIGKGLLLKAIHEHLDEHPLVKNFRSGTLEEGGNGVTVVTLK
jgi:DNA mismatch repair protein MutS2